MRYNCACGIGSTVRICGGVAERPKAPVLKTGVVKATAGSNPVPSASYAYDSTTTPSIMTGDTEKQ